MIEFFRFINRYIGPEHLYNCILFAEKWLRQVVSPVDSYATSTLRRGPSKELGLIL